MQRITDEALDMFNECMLKSEIQYHKTDYEKILALSDQMTHDASIYQKPILLKYSTLLYCIAKMLKTQKSKSYSLELGKVFCLFHTKLKKMKAALSKNDLKEFEKLVDQMFKLISSNDDKFNIYVQDMIHSTLIKKGSKLVQHGISIETVSELTGINQWDLYNYMGKTNYETLLDEKTRVTERRLHHAKKLFKVK